MTVMAIAKALVVAARGSVRIGSIAIRRTKTGGDGTWKNNSAAVMVGTTATPSKPAAEKAGDDAENENLKQRRRREGNVVKVERKHDGDHAVCDVTNLGNQQTQRCGSFPSDSSRPMPFMVSNMRE